MTNHQLIETFYTAFSKGNPENMTACYHPDIVFEDPAFGRLTGNRAVQMWHMLLSNKSAAPQVTYSNVQTDDNKGNAAWRAEYFYGPNKRKVVNEVQAAFVFKDGEIIKHTDTFDLWKWSRQALGPVGALLGWTPIIKNKVNTIANGKLDEYISALH